MLRFAVLATFALTACAVDPSPIDPGCETAVDCGAGRVCTDGRCRLPAGCTDGAMNGDETGVDCGGRCGGCSLGEPCGGDGDCSSEACVAGRCAEASCADGSRNGDESDVDCGGECDACPNGLDCGSDGDCASAICSSGRCVGPTCVDGRAGGDETDVDCGGSCGPCATGSTCNAGPDCAQGVCASGVCAAPTCDDGVVNGTETDLDCGSECPGCGAGAECATNGDCASEVCAGGRCAAPVCPDGVLNGLETDLDCGGPDCLPCAAGSTCLGASDCRSGVCEGGSCAAAACDDSVLNGEETDVDCGGPACGDCGNGRLCDGPSDCVSGVCDAGTCVAAACTDGVRNGQETDADCGGPDCADCAVGAMCGGASDCVTGVCTGGACAAAACTDGVRNGQETDADCGGPDCADCAVGAMCGGASDCVTGVCTGGACAAAACTDGVRNGVETDVDCGGPTCADCAVGAMCGGASDCVTGVCTGGACAAAACTDGVRNGAETDVDCGGPTCADCAVGAMCGGASDCVTGVCTGGACAAAACTDGVRNGAETDVDCGGPTCADCAVGAMCGGASDCVTGVCTGGACAAAACTDGVRNGMETDVDCGGPTCADCAVGAMCGGASDCVTGVCTGGACAAAACTDGVRNGMETDVDCGGPTCADCGEGRTCAVAADCSTDACIGSICVNGPTAGLTVSPTSGPAPLLVTATSTATAGSAAITSVAYDFGGGFAATRTHTFAAAGSYSVVQRVTDANGLQDTAMVPVIASMPVPTGCFLSATDKSPDTRLLLTPEMLGAEWLNLQPSGVRSECAIAPGSGVFYYEATIAPYDCDRTEAPEGCYATPLGLLGIGVATAAAPLTQPPGSSTRGFSIDTGGSYFYDGAYLGNVPRDSTETYGFVVDYRGTNPVVHLITGEYGTPAVVHSQTLSAVTTGVHAMLSGPRRKVGVEAQVNFGNDTTNRPFDFDAAAALAAAGLSAEATALVEGFGATYAGVANARPTLTVSASRTVALGSPVTLTGTASDAEDGSLTGDIYWEDMATVHGSRTDGVGGTFTFTPASIGLHPVRATVFDSGGGRRQAIVRVRVTGALTSFDPVRLVNDPLVDPGVGSGIVTDGLRVKWTVADKMGIRANQGLYGDFWYFEITRLSGPVNQGGGLVIRDGDLDPYSADNVPPSMSINTSGGVWQNIIYYAGYDTSASTYGFAVDYRGQSPRVYVVVGGSVVAEWVMVDTFVPVYPMLYGNPTGFAGTYDETINFGATSFGQNPCTALSAWGVSAADVGALELGWGDANTATRCP